MKWVLFAMAGAAAVTVTITFIGWMLPKEHIATRKARFEHSAADLFAVMSGPPDWRPDVKKYEELKATDGRRQWRKRRVGAMPFCTRWRSSRRRGEW